jgi:hypothetical protein
MTNVKLEGNKRLSHNVSHRHAEPNQLVAYGRHSERLDEAVQVRLHDRLAFEVVRSFRNIEHVDVIL